MVYLLFRNIGSPCKYCTVYSVYLHSHPLVPNQLRTFTLLTYVYNHMHASNLVTCTP